eukprot:GHVR01042390.1.p1 GENE.GHVR01042390.1~~GHVR01042390.1.p1  ORF type:complete len:447 (-),score=73.25 GHVR01042390.1:288-1628(-)
MIQSTDDRNALLSMAKADSHGVALHEHIVSTLPDWEKYERAGFIQVNASHKLKMWHLLSLEDKSDKAATDPTLDKILFDSISIEGDIQPSQYVLAQLYDIMRDDTSRYDAVSDMLPDLDIYNALINVLSRVNVDQYASDKALVLLCGFMCRTPQRFTTNQVSYVCREMGGGKWKMSENGRLEALSNLLKIDSYRVMVWDTPNIPEIILKELNADTGRQATCLYRAGFCVWLLAANENTRTKLIDGEIVRKLKLVLAESRVEKVVRVCVHTLQKLMDDHAGLEQIVEENLVQVLQLLEYEKWRDSDMYTEITEVAAELLSKIKLFSNFERYERELASGKLRWSFLHAEKFWHENVGRFEEKEFRAVRELVGLLETGDPQSLAVSCHDIGEFATLHPMGKKILQKLHAKEAVMTLLAHKEREVAREALLCVQKLMIERWQDAALPPTR